MFLVTTPHIFLFQHPQHVDLLLLFIFIAVVNKDLWFKAWLARLSLFKRCQLGMHGLVMVLFSFFLLFYSLKNKLINQYITAVALMIKIITRGFFYLCT